MINHKTTWISLGLCGMLFAGMSFMVTGCANEEDQQVQAPPAPPPPPPLPPPPAITPIDQLMAELNIDPRVSLPEDKAPNNDVDRKAVLVFFDAFARGNAPSLKGMLDVADQLELQALVDSGAWKNATSSVRRIDVQTGNNDANKCALAVIEVASGADISYQPQLWYYTTEQESAKFEAVPAPPGIMDQLSGDWIAAWHQILAEELALADKPDEDIELAQRNLESEEEQKPGEMGTPGGSGPGSLRPPRTPVKPPDEPGGPAGKP